MRAIGIRELKNRLSHYLRPESATGLAALVRGGSATAGAPQDASVYIPRPRALDPGRLAELLDAERPGLGARP